MATMEEIVGNLTEVLEFLKENEAEFNAFLEKRNTPKPEPKKVPEGEVARIINSGKYPKEKKKVSHPDQFRGICFEDEDYEKVGKLLNELGMPAHIVGYEYLREAILLWKVSLQTIKVTKDIYPEVARRFKAPSCDSVERTSRYAIKVAYERGNLKLWDEIFGYAVKDLKAKPTNSQFIAILTDYCKRM